MLISRFPYSVKQMQAILETVSFHLYNVQPYLMRNKCAPFVLSLSRPSWPRKLGCKGFLFKFDASIQVKRCAWAP